MFFKNLKIFRLTEQFAFDAESLAEKLASMEFQPCAGQQMFSMGWTAPLGKKSEELVFDSNGFLMVCLKKEERILPNTVINEMLQERIDEIEEREGRKLSKKAKAELKDNLIFELMPRAFKHSTTMYAYIDTKNGFVVIDSSSTKKAEDLLSTLRKSLEGLPAIPLIGHVDDKPLFVMTDWLNLGAPNDFTIDDECELVAPEEGGAVIRCKRIDLGLPEVQNHLDNGKSVVKVLVNWQDRLSFVLDENLSVNRLKFLDLIQEQVAQSECETAEEKFEVDFAIMTSELEKFIASLIKVFGGEKSAF